MLHDVLLDVAFHWSATHCYVPLGICTWAELRCVWLMPSGTVLVNLTCPNISLDISLLCPLYLQSDVLLHDMWFPARCCSGSGSPNNYFRCPASAHCSELCLLCCPSFYSSNLCSLWTQQQSDIDTVFVDIVSINDVNLVWRNRNKDNLYCRRKIGTVQPDISTVNSCTTFFILKACDLNIDRAGSLL